MNIRDMSIITQDVANLLHLTNSALVKMTTHTTMEATEVQYFNHCPVMQ